MKFNDIRGEKNITSRKFYNCVFTNCDFTKADFSHAKNYSINPLINKIKNAKFAMPDAIRLLASFEVKIDF